MAALPRSGRLSRCHPKALAAGMPLDDVVEQNLRLMDDLRRGGTRGRLGVRATFLATQDCAVVWGGVVCALAPTAPSPPPSRCSAP